MKLYEFFFILSINILSIFAIEHNITKSTLPSQLNIHFHNESVQNTTTTTAAVNNSETINIIINNNTNIINKTEHKPLINENTPKNFILLLVEQSEGETAWKSFKINHSSSCFHEGFLPSSHSLNITNGNLNQETCNCKNNLKFYINHLMSWARIFKEMNTATITSGDFNLLPFQNHHHYIPIPLFKEEILPKSYFHQKFSDSRVKRSVHKRILSEPTVTTSAGSAKNEFESANKDFESARKEYESSELIWSLFNNFRKMRSTLMKFLVDSFYGNTFNEENLSSSTAFHPSNFNDLIRNTLIDLKTADSKDRGFIMVASVPNNQLSSISDLILHQISTNDTLLIITGICSTVKEFIPYYIIGPQSDNLIESIHTTDELPIGIKMLLHPSYKNFHFRNFKPKISVHLTNVVNKTE